MYINPGYLLQKYCSNEINSRGYIYQSTIDTILLNHRLDDKNKITFYIGIDPTSDSLHIGHLLPLLLGFRLIQYGHRMIILLGGATGKIGDPSGRNKERNILDESQIDKNILSIKKQILRIFTNATISFHCHEDLDFYQYYKEDLDYIMLLGNIDYGKLFAQYDEDQYYFYNNNNIGRDDISSFKEKNISRYKDSSEEIIKSNKNNVLFLDDNLGKYCNLIFVNNKNWLEQELYLDFLYKIGRYFNVNKMLHMDSVKNRLDSGNISLAEFNYTLMQAYDFYYLYDKYNCTLQIGGQDQWCNIISGVELIRKIQSNESKNFTKAYGFTFELLLDSDGNKIGKSVSSADKIELKTSCQLSEDDIQYHANVYYNFWRNIEDKLVLKLLKLFTFLPITEIQDYGEKEESFLKKSDYYNRLKELLAYEATAMRFGTPLSKFIAFKNKKNYGSKDYDCKNELGTTSDIIDMKFTKELYFKYNNWHFENKFKTVGYNQDTKLRLSYFMKFVGLCDSIGKAKFLISQGVVKFNNEKIEDIFYEFSFSENGIRIEDDVIFKCWRITITIGKRNFEYFLEIDYTLDRD